MPKYWLDSDFLVQGKNKHYAFDIAPGFWEGLKKARVSGLIASPMRVFDELAAGKDDLARWVKDMKRAGFFIEGNREVQGIVTSIVDFVEASYGHSGKKAEFVKGADPWVIAHAKAAGAIVVTHEKLVPSSSTYVKIPNVCKEFGVLCADPYDMLRDIGLKLVLTQSEAE